MINALSFHNKDTHNHNRTPIIDNPRSYGARPATPLMDIALSTKTDAIHLIYQSRVYFGVIDSDDLSLIYNIPKANNPNTINSSIIMIPTTIFVIKLIIISS